MKAAHTGRRAPRRRASRKAAAMLSNEARARGSRAAAAPVPKSLRLTAVSQYWKGGFSKYSTPFRVGVIQSPLASISRGIWA